MDGERRRGSRTCGWGIVGLAGGGGGRTLSWMGKGGGGVGLVDGVL